MKRINDEFIEIMKEKQYQNIEQIIGKVKILQ